MGSGLIAYLVAAVVAASHAPAAPSGATAALAARPLHGSVVLRARPGGKALERVGPRGALGGPLVLGVVAVRGRWVEVTAEALPNGRYGWVEFGRDVAVRPIRWTLRASLSRHALYVLRDGRTVRKISVGVGRPGSPTPIGHFAVAEKLTGPFGPAFGPRILALTARQPRLPAGWNRSVTYWVAIHAGAGRGSAVSAGCLHATEAVVRYLMRTVPLGTPVVIAP
ncbi:MAG TPA: L,D-transpeptidase [Gaiellaceae bacterium]|nr:L,D-transpeptidase [Gaiellaceae bacterium]